MSLLQQWKMNSPVGTLYLVASEAGLRGVFWESQALPQASSRAGKNPGRKILAEAERQLIEYFSRRRREFDLPLDFSGTPFQERVWRELRRIPYGETIAYRDLARKIGRAKAVRAVGTTNGKNPLCIVVPCHRVIAAGGGLGGYSGGLPAKSKLLALEGASFPPH
jgi:methylated-DNA-[protein]-cysteine S-methyltransferase